MPRKRTLPLALLAALAATAPPASAATVDVGGTTLRFVADPGVRNKVTVALVPAAGAVPAQLAITDAGTLTPLIAGAGCAAAGTTVRCPAAGLRVSVDTGDLDDTITVTANVPTTLVDGAGNDVVTGGPGADAFVGAAGDDVLDGGAGDDTFGNAGGAGADRVAGGPGADLADYLARSTAVAVRLDDVAGDGAPGERDDVRSDVESVTGGGGDDLLVGSAAANTLRGGNGDDRLDGGPGADTYAGGNGKDVADYSARTVAVTADPDGRADDGAAGENDLIGTDVEDLTGGSANDVLTGTNAAQRLTGGAGNDTLEAGGGDDVLDGGAGADRLAGDDGTDLADYSGRGAPVRVDLEAGTGGAAGEGDTVDAEGVLGGAAADVLRGDAGRNDLRGGPGDDVLDGALGADRLEGGGGFDAVTYAGRRAGVTVDSSGGAGDGQSGEGDDVRPDVEHLVGTPYGDRLTGTDGAHDLLEGGRGDDALNGRAGNDRLDGGAGEDTLSGGAGDDVLLGAEDDDSLGGGDGNDAFDGGSGNDALRGDGGNDALAGATGNDSLSGGDGADTADGGDGDDSLSGGTGDDVLRAGEGANRVNGDDGHDRLEAGGGADQLSGGAGNDALAAGGGADKLSGSDGTDQLDGGPGDDQLDGGVDADTVHGGDGTDAVRGGGGDDVLDGGAGADQIAGDDGTDLVDYGARGDALDISNDGKADDGSKGERDNVATSVDGAIGGGGADRITFANDAPHRLDGGAGDDRLSGGAKEDALIGGPGADDLIGKAGLDTFDGGAGDDRLSSADAVRERLLCGAGKDRATLDAKDVPVSCETRTTSSGSAPDDTVPLSASPGTLTGPRRVTTRGRFVAIPGFPGERIDSRLVADVRYLVAKYRLRVTDGYAQSGHAPGGEHPRGLAVDVVPGPGGSWSDVDRLARWAEPKQNRPRSPFRWVGYDGDRGHGRGHHLHLSWRHATTKRGKPARWVMTLGVRRAAKAPSLRNLSARSNARLGGKPSVRSGLRAAPRCGGAAQLVPTFKAAAKAFGIRWSILAGISEIESGHGCDLGPSKAGAVGWTQFMPATWKVWGMDADGDGRASPSNSVDAIFSSARFLRASGAPRSYRRALFAYNHAQWYVDSVLSRAKRYR